MIIPLSKKIRIRGTADCWQLERSRLVKGQTSVPRQTVCNLLSFSLPRFTFSRMSVADLVQM